MRSIAQAATELQISRQRVYYWIGRPELQRKLARHVRDTDKGKQISDAGIAIIRQHLDAQPDRPADPQPDDQQAALQQQIIAAQQSHIETLTAQLAERTAEAQHLHKLLDQSQILHRGLQDQIKQLEAPGDPELQPSRRFRFLGRFFGGV